MKLLHTIHPVGEYNGSTIHQQVHEADHDDLLQLYYDINQMEEADRTQPLDKFTVVNEHGIFTSCPSVVESYVIVG